MPKINAAYVFDVALASQADPRLFQTNPTLAAGDVKVSIDEGALANLTTLPVVTPAGSKNVKVSLNAAEMNGNRIVVLFSDVAGGEWCDLELPIETSPDDLTIANIAAATVTASDALQKNVAFANFEFMMYDEADHLSGKTGLAVTAQRSVDGAAYVACTNSPTEVGDGLYKINFAAADLNGDTITFRFTATDADPTIFTVVTSA